MYTGCARDWVNNSLSGVFYVVFGCLLASYLFRRASATKLVIAVFAATGVLEVLQAWHLPFLERLRSFFLGRAFLGTSFVGSDFVYYALGSALGWQWAAGVRRLEDRENS